MIGCHIGRNFQVTVAGGSYQDGLSAILLGHPPGMLLSEQEIYFLESRELMNCLVQEKNLICQ